MRQVFIVAVFLWSALAGAAQTTAHYAGKIKRLNVGDKVPSIPIDKMMDARGNITKTNIADYSDRLLILDMMNTHCSGCIAGLPRKDSLQRKFGDKIKIIITTSEQASYIRNYLKNENSYPVKKGVKLPWIVEDDLLEQYFPYVTVSHFAWIYKGTVVAITDQEYVDENNIKKFLSGEIVNLPVKYEVLGFDYTKQPMFQVASTIPSDDPSTAFYSVVSGYQTGLVPFVGGSVIDSLKKTIRIYLPNARSLLSAYRQAYGNIYTPGEKPFASDARLLLEVKDSSRYLYETSLGYFDAWSRKNGVCYEGIFPFPMTVKECYQQMVSDLDRSFGTHAGWKKRNVRCFVITQRLSDEEIAKLTETNKQYTYVDTNGRAHNGKTGPFGRESSLRQLSFQYSFKNAGGKELPLVIDSKYLGTIILHFDDLKSTGALKTALAQYGFDLKEEEAETEMFVLTDSKK
jgi:hypothetical protein